MCIWVYGRWGEEGGASAPPPPSPLPLLPQTSFQFIFFQILYFFEQNADDSGKVLGRTHSKRQSRPGYDVCLAKIKLRYKDPRFYFGKAMHL